MHRFGKYVLFISILVIFSIVVMKKNKQDFRLVRTTPQWWQRKYVTKSMSELGQMDEINRHVLFLNTVPGTGSEILVLLLQKMQGINNFRHFRLKNGQEKLNSKQQERLVTETYDLMRNNAIPLSLDKKVCFTNFTKFNRQSPTFINLIREPTDKLVSKFSKDTFFKQCINENNCNHRLFQTTIPFFCGHDQRCFEGNKWALIQAKTNVDKYYSIVGVLEEFNATLDILETKIPYFFKGVRDIYRKNLIHKFKKKRISVKIRKRLKLLLINEYDFYDWIKSRLFDQLKTI